MKWRVLVFLAIVGAGFMTAAQTLPPVIVTAPPPPPTLPPVTVTAPRVEGGTIVCRDSACAGVIAAMRQDRIRQYVQAQLPPPAPDSILLEQALFCSKLNGGKPSGCSFSNPPASPGIVVPGKAPWAPNGCGTGGVGGWFQDFVLERIAGTAYSGQLDMPYSGVSFRGACDSHDQCWAEGKGRAQCDMNFRDSMNAACGQLGDAGSIAGCSGFASLYHGAVSTTDGANNAYDSSTGNRKCAVWANSMKENGCEG